MSIYSDYLKSKKRAVLSKPIDGAELLSEIITQIQGLRKHTIITRIIYIFIYNTVRVLRLQLVQSCFKEYSRNSGS
jgi:hypothetical protein